MFSKVETGKLQGEKADEMDSEMSMIRYIAWAIPSIGFVGTVRGIISVVITETV